MRRLAGVLIPMLLAAAAVALAQTPVTITTTSPLPTGYLNLSYGLPPGFQGLQFTDATNPSQAVTTWSIVVGPGSNPPPGLSMTSTGFLSGSPTVLGDYTFTVHASTPYGATDKAFTLTVATPQISFITTSPLPVAFVGQPYSFTLSANNAPALGVSWSAPANTLPPGLFLDQSGILSGTPTTANTYIIPVTAHILGTTVTAIGNFTITIYGGQVQILTTTLPPAAIGQGYSAQLLANPTGATWQLAGSALPPGIGFNTTTGVLSGTGTIPGTYRFAVQAVYPNYLPAAATFTLYVTNGPLTILQNSLPVAIQNAPYRTTLTPQGGLSPFSWAVGTNSLNFSIDADAGVILGTPTVAPGTSYPLTVVLSDVTGTRFTQSYSVFVAAPLSIATTSLPNGTLNSPYAQAVTAAGGQSPYIFVLAPTSPPLPPGLSMGTDGVIRGIPTVNGVYPIIAQVTDFGQRTITANLVITIGGTVTLDITPGSLPDGQPGVPYPPPNGGGVQLTATGGTGPYTFSAPANSLPQGLSLSSNGLISGIPVGPPTAPLGTSTFTVSVRDSSASASPLTGQKTYTLNITLPLSIGTASLPNGTIGTPYPQSGVQFILQASGGQPPYNFSIASGTVPAGLRLDPTGVFSGTPSGPAGVSTITILVQDAGGQTSQKQFTITIAAAGAPPVISTGDLTGTVGTAFSATLAATGGTSPYTFALVSGTPPAGLTFNASTATLSGTPTASGSASLNFSVTDSQQQTASKTINITINLPPPPSATISTTSVSPAQQPSVNLSLGSAYPADINGTLSVSFQSAAGGSPAEVQFVTSAGGSSSVTFTIPKGQLNAPTFQIVTGTVSGTIAITAKFTSGGVDVTPSPAPLQLIQIKPAAPVIQSVAFSNTGGVVAVTVIGYSTTREIVSGDFVFAVSTGNTVANGGDVTVPLTTPFTTWYSSTASNPFGGQFKLTIPFNVANGTSASVTSVSVTLTNTVGTSPRVSPQ